MGRVKVGAVTYSVYLAPDGAPELDGTLGICDPEKHTIHILDCQAPQALLDTLVHELTHALLSETGIQFMLWGHMADTERKFDAEEHVIRVLTPHLIDLISQLRKPTWAKRLSKLWPEKKAR